ncbi:DoxX family membrane protein [Schaalia sp. ZJ405]|uniref:DoxX family membrane protein n=1 Tax=Schaalia sp. ZJ405 TaxID=2709403 RepID=UPI0013EAE440|nr:DoxX family membrane protein [Schaalia sp. ZJ405]QPK80725.1 DoxX family membrane protein [Schaalia sp. ZJ405]
MSILRFIARPLLAAPFIADGFSAIREPDVHVERAEDIRPLMNKVVPGHDLSDQELRTLTRILGTVTTTAGLCFALGKFPRATAGVLTAVAVPMALVNHPVRGTSLTREEIKENRSGLMRKLALAAGVALATTDRQGRPSATWRLSNWRDQRLAIAQARAAERARVERKFAE